MSIIEHRITEMRHRTHYQPQTMKSWRVKKLPAQVMLLWKANTLSRLERANPFQILFQFSLRLPQIHGPLGVEPEISAVAEQS